MSILLVTGMLVTTGCGHEHTWTEATCTTAKTCSECGEAEGEGDWVETTEYTYDSLNKKTKLKIFFMI